MTEGSMEGIYSDTRLRLAAQALELAIRTYAPASDNWMPAFLEGVCATLENLARYEGSSDGATAESLVDIANQICWDSGGRLGRLPPEPAERGEQWLDIKRRAKALDLLERAGRRAAEIEDQREPDMPSGPDGRREPPWSELDPGIADVVGVLFKAGFTPTDSGDGLTKIGGPMDVDNGVMRVPHVHVMSTPTSLIADVERAEAVLEEAGYKLCALEGWQAEGHYVGGVAGVLVTRPSGPEVWRVELARAEEARRKVADARRAGEREIHYDCGVVLAHTLRAIEDFAGDSNPRVRAMATNAVNFWDEV